MAAADKKAWADGPFELIPRSRLPYKKGDKIKRAHHLAVEMVLVHNMLLRGINSIYRQAVAVERTPERVRDFVGYAAVWADTVEEHHGGEETVVFPELERRLGLPGLMDGNVAQHRAFHAGLEAYAAYTAAVLAGDEVYDGVRFRALIDSFMPVLREHLSDEIDTLLRLDEHDDKTDLAVFMTDIQKQLTSRAQDPDIKYTILPFVFGAHDVTWDEDGTFGSFPPVPWFVGVLLRWVFAGKYKNRWLFSPCDLHGRPRELAYADE